MVTIRSPQGMLTSHLRTINRHSLCMVSYGTYIGIRLAQPPEFNTSQSREYWESNSMETTSLRWATKGEARNNPIVSPTASLLHNLSKWLIGCFYSLELPSYETERCPGTASLIFLYVFTAKHRVPGSASRAPCHHKLCVMSASITLVPDNLFYNYPITMVRGWRNSILSVLGRSTYSLPPIPTLSRRGCDYISEVLVVLFL